MTLVAQNIKEQSKIDYSVSLEPGQVLSNELITMGAIQRIADATELMASNFKKLQDDRDMYKRWYESECEKSNSILKLNNRILKSKCALKGHITRLKKRLELLNEFK